MLELTAAPVSLADIDRARSGVWRYPSLLPPVADSVRISLGEATTPLVMRDPGSFLKLDYFLPTGSYKDRGATVLVSRLADLGVKNIVLESSGNAGAALSAYCAAAGITCQVFSPALNSRGKLAQISAVGGQLKPIMGSQGDAMKAAMAAAKGSFYASPNWSPDFVAGVATVAIELWEQLGRRVPSSVLAPCGHGGIITSLFRGFDALMRGGLIGKLPRLIAVQAAGFDSVVDAITNGLAEPVSRGTGRTTIAEGIACDLPIRGGQAIDVIRKSSGTAVAVSEAEISQAALQLAGSGFYVEPTAAVAFAGLIQLRDQGAGNQLGDSPVVVLGSSGLKSGSLLADLRSPDWWPANV
jgi:threonine synthase